MSAASPVWKVFGLGALVAARTLAAPVSLDGLVTDSPFVLKQDESAAPAPTENANVEFRGLINTKEGLLFGLYDRTKNTGVWVKKDDGHSDFKISSYDASSEMLTVEYLGQRLNLTLPSAKIGAAAPTPLPVVNAGQSGARLGTPQINATKTATDQQRLESVAAEVRRRRALRQAAAAQAGTTPAPAPTSGQQK